MTATPTDVLRKLKDAMVKEHRRLGFLGDEPGPNDVTGLYGVSVTYGEICAALEPAPPALEDCAKCGRKRTVA